MIGYLKKTELCGIDEDAYSIWKIDDDKGIITLIIWNKQTLHLNSYHGSTIFLEDQVDYWQHTAWNRDLYKSAEMLTKEEAFLYLL